MPRSHAASFPDGYTGLPPGKIAAVVTYLEMRHPPAAVRRDDPPGLRLRRTERPETAWYRRLFRRVGEDWLWFSRLQLDDRQLAAILHDPAVDVFTLEHEGEDKGLLELDRRDPPAIELAYLGVSKDLIGKRAGRFLMDRALEIAWSHRPDRLFVHTCSLDHPGALSFYMRAGFVPYKRAIEVADDPRLTGALPGTACPQVPIIARS